MHLLLLNLRILLYLLAIKHIFISIWRLTQTSISTLGSSFFLLHTIASHCKTFILLRSVLNGISLIYLDAIYGFLAA